VLRLIKGAAPRLGLTHVDLPGNYGASKAALIQASEALRFEVEPLGIRVITLITGGVQTKILANLEPVQLPENSYYHGIKHVIECENKRIPLAQAPEDFARDVLQRVEGRM
jgi:1-acylglycerone phosphate reductase